MDDLCGSPFWDYNRIWNTTGTPDSTPCFQSTVLVWVPSAWLFLLTPLEIFYIRRQKYRFIPWAALNVARFVGTCLLIAMSIFTLGVHIQREQVSVVHTSVLIGAAVIDLITYLLVLVVEIFDRMSGLHSSAVLFTFWIVKTVASAAVYYSWMVKSTSEQSTDDILLFVTVVTNFPLVCCKLILSCAADDVVIRGKAKRKPCPVQYSSPLSNILFSWFGNLAWKGFKCDITENDLWTLDEGCQSANCYAEYEKLAFKNANASGQQRSQKTPSIMKMIWQMNKWEIMVAILVKLIGDILQFVNPLMLKELINFVSSNQPDWKGYVYTAAIFASSISTMICLNNHGYRMQLVAIRAEAAVVSAIYRKAFRMSNTFKQHTSVGKIVTLMSVDAQRVTHMWMDVSQIISMPLQVSVAVYLLWDLLGFSVIVGLGIIIIMIPLNTVIAKITSKLYVKIMDKKDKRTKLINELFYGIKVLKLYAWEKPFTQNINSVRALELLVLKKSLYVEAVLDFILQAVPFLIALCTFATYVLSDENNILTATKIFVSLSLFDIISIPLMLIPDMTTHLVKAVVSGKRIKKFMTNEELNPNFVSHDLIEDDPIIINKGTFSWGKDDTPILKDINLRVPQGHIVAVVGSVGSGKSALVSAMLGELEKRSGRVNIKGSLAYVAQQAWIKNTTFRENITFGHLFLPALYDKVLEACALKPDLAIFTGGDQTEIGEKGVNISGGQKQRVSIARAVYSEADVYLFDDPLSAVDAHVGKHIFDEVLGPKGLLKKKTRILVTNGISYLPYVNLIIVLKNSTISEFGTYKELLEKKGDFAEFVTTYQKKQEDMADELLEMQEDVFTQTGNQVFRRLLSVRTMRSLSSDEESLSPDFIQHKPSKERSRSSQRSLSIDSEKVAKTEGKLTQDEQMESGVVSWSVYKYYLQSVGNKELIATITTVILMWGCSFGSNYWLSLWSVDQPNLDGSQDSTVRDLRLSVYGGIGFGQAIFVLSTAMALVLGTINASTTLHDNMLVSVLRSPMAFFDTTPLGRILNRFSQDVDIMDTVIPTLMYEILACTMQIIGTVVIISMGSPIFLIIFIPISIIYYIIQRLYIGITRQLKRMASVSRSPIYVHFSETISGLQTLRAFGMQDRSIKVLEKRINMYNALRFTTLGAKRWLGIRLAAVGDTVVLSAAIFAVTGRGTLDPGVVGLSVNYAMSVTFVIMWLVRNWTELESNIVSVERIKEYSELEQEAPLVVNEFRPLSMWPEEGKVQFYNYSTRYRKGLDLVLHNFTCEIATKEKIGIVGRTGAGKSSLTLALFRLIEGTEGTIVIDGIDIGKIGLHDLRSKLTIIPQDPVLFSGSLRTNLDPFDKYSDDDLWLALEHSYLKEFIKNLPAGLQHEISEGGDNLSFGQRQLVCLARALLRKTKVLILDEATAGVDLETDDLIQATIRKEFADCTVLTIAHRLNTIMDSTRVMVLSNGVMQEFDTPTNLLQNNKSIFHSLAKDAGLV